MPVVGEYKRGERGREAPKSLLGEKMIEASANIALRITFVCVSVLRDEEDGRERGGLGRSPPPPFIDTRRGRVHVRGVSEAIAFSPNFGVQWSATVESTLWGTGEYGVGHGSCPGQPISLAEIAPVSW